MISAKCSLMELCWRLRPSAPNLIWMGIVKPLEFFQFEIQGGIFQSSISFLVSFLGGDLNNWGGGDPGPLGNFLCLWRGGNIGSTCTEAIRTTLYFWLSLVSPLDVNFTISDVVLPNFWILVPNAAYFLIPRISSIFYLVLVWTSTFFSSEGLARSLVS